MASNRASGSVVSKTSERVPLVRSTIVEAKRLMVSSAFLSSAARSGEITSANTLSAPIPTEQSSTFDPSLGSSTGMNPQRISACANCSSANADSSPPRRRSMTGPKPLNGSHATRVSPWSIALTTNIRPRAPCACNSSRYLGQRRRSASNARSTSTGAWAGTAPRHHSATNSDHWETMSYRKSKRISYASSNECTDTALQIHGLFTRVRGALLGNSHPAS